MTTEDLKPCPFCGNAPKVVEGGDIYCVDCMSGEYPQSRIAWENSYCWKEIDRLKAENERLTKERGVYREVGIMIYATQLTVKVGGGSREADYIDEQAAKLMEEKGNE